MAGIWAVAELAEGTPTRLTLEIASLASKLAADGGADARIVLVGGSETAANEIAAYGATVVNIASTSSDNPSAAQLAAVLAEMIGQKAPELVLIGASPDGKDVAGALLGLTDLPILVSATSVTALDGTADVQMNTFGGRLITTSGFVEGGGIVLVRPGAMTATPAGQAGAVEQRSVTPARTLPAVTVTERVTEAAAGPSIDDARVIIGAGRGVAGPDGIALVGELAASLDGALGATRAAVDSGWIDFGQQIGQTGKTVKPDLYIACGISGAIQHKVGVQSAGTIIAINKDPDAPIAEFADLVVVGDLFEIVPRLTAALREARAGD